MSPERNWFCAQLGAREHYAIPRTLYVAGALKELMTDYWAGTVTRTLAQLAPSKMTKSLAARSHREIPDELVHSWNLRAIAWEARLQQQTHSGGVVGRYMAYCDVGRRFSEAVGSRMKAHGKLPAQSVFFGYDTCSLEVMQQLKDRGVVCILDQIDPSRIEIEMVQAEQQAWPGWQSYQLDVPDEFYQRHQEEWDVADKIIVNSDFSRDALVKQGVSFGKIEVVPLSYEPSARSKAGQIDLANSCREEVSRGFTEQRPLHVLFLGQVMLRKGIQYMVKAAELLQEYPVVFDVVGPLNITEEAIKRAPQNVRFHGRVTRDAIGHWYQKSHVFILPTLSDGFAITQLEAMAHGLPVIATPNCGAVVTDGVDGLIVPPRNPESIAGAVRQYLEDPSRLVAHRSAALRKSKTFSLERVAASLLAIGQGVQTQLDSCNSHA